ncbi:hypothetical protein [Actinomadura parmotrematis]|uniref:Uncharacterized protein n=1 Tax=Actinomadura parmotrematis TaxID=2864039 RepID=A0ABS7FPL2_9ACTN|nr:hypothetical protein [Actinomadura parmotrematis]MBW8482246.1 hypothetical protein [Actinomadura parmotrematis]
MGRQGETPAPERSGRARRPGADGPGFPPGGCGFEVRYTLGRRGHGVEAFPDEFELGRWFTMMIAEGKLRPERFTEPDEDGQNGYQIFCVTPAGRQRISYFHPRLVRGRIEGTAAAPRDR